MLQEDPSPVSADVTENVYALEKVRTTAESTDELDEAIVRTKELIAQLSTADNEKLAELFSLVRLLSDTVMRRAGFQPRLNPYVIGMVAARQAILEHQLSPEIVAKAETVHEGPRGERIEYAIELSRDVAKYLSKIGKLTGDKTFHALAAEVLDVATRKLEKTLTIKEKITPAPERESYNLAHFERVIELDLAGDKTIHPDEALAYAELIMPSDQPVSNWDRQAAVGWWLFELGIRHMMPHLMREGWQRMARGVDASKVEGIKRKYILTRLGSNVAEINRHGQFLLESTESKTAIKKKLALPS